MDTFKYSGVKVSLLPDPEDGSLFDAIVVEDDGTSIEVTTGTQFQVTKPWVNGLVPTEYEYPYVRVAEDIEFDETAEGWATVLLEATFDGPEIILELSDFLDAILDGTLRVDQKMMSRYTSA